MSYRYVVKPVLPPRVPVASNYARHLRGKVRIRNGLVVMDVVNTNTNQVVASDNVALHTIYGRGAGLALMVQDATEVTAAARIAWMCGFGRKVVSK